MQSESKYKRKGEARLAEIVFRVNCTKEYFGIPCDPKYRKLSFAEIQGTIIDVLAGDKYRVLPIRKPRVKPGEVPSLAVIHDTLPHPVNKPHKTEYSNITPLSVFSTFSS